MVTIHTPGMHTWECALTVGSPVSVLGRADGNVCNVTYPVQAQSYPNDLNTKTMKPVYFKFPKINERCSLKLLNNFGGGGTVVLISTRVIFDIQILHYN